MRGRRVVNAYRVRCAANATPRATSKRVAVIGAGVSGLACAKICRNEGHSVQVFEQRGSIGGTWVVDAIAKDLQSMNVLKDGWNRASGSVHSSMYDNLRTNLPREIMGFTDYPFDTNFPGSADPRQFCSHQEVRRYLEAFKEQFNLDSMIQLNTAVTRVEPVHHSDPTWEVEIQSDGEIQVRQFDAVAICNGHYTVPFVPSIDGIEHFKKPLLHSHLYRNAQPFIDQTVLVLGNANSGQDLAQEMGLVAEKVFLSGRKWPAEIDLSEPLGCRRNIHRVGAVASCSPSGVLKLQDGLELPEVDVLIFCTGYKFEFPFLQEGLISTDTHGIVYPLYKYLLHPSYPTLSFLGLPVQTVPCVIAEYQAHLISRVLSGSVTLPSAKEMISEIDSSLAAYKAEHGSLESCWRIRDSVFEYLDELAALSGIDRLPRWRFELMNAKRAVQRQYPESYRERPLDGAYLEQARREFASIRDS